MPSTLYITSPKGQQQCAGEYALLEGVEANGEAVWEQSGGSFWLYSSGNGMWIVGGRDAKEKNFKSAHGLMFNRTLHGGATPDRVGGVWERLDDEQWRVDEKITVSKVCHRPFSLRVVTPNGHQRSAGEYVLVPDVMGNGLPVWKQQNGKSYLYAGNNGSWIIGGADAKEKNFKCSRGVIYSKNASGGLMPDKVGGVWLRLSGDKFHEDSAISVAIKPSPLYVTAPNGQQRCAGEYTPVSDRMANGYPLWKHTSGKCFLYSGSNGMWIIGGTDAEAKDFKCTRGVIYCKNAHSGQMPEKMTFGSWLRLDKDNFREDAAIFVSTQPASLFILTPNGQHRASGEYLAASDKFRGLPLWKQRKGHFRVCSAGDGTWMVVNAMPKEGQSLEDELASAVLRCETPHAGLMPDKVAGTWSRRADDDLTEDADIKVASSIHSKPHKLHVTTPNGQQKCGGEYMLEANDTANNHPLWKQSGGKYWLYSGTNGLWILGSSGAKKQKFECSRGVIYSSTPHGGNMPNQVPGGWLRLDGEKFVEDGAINVHV